MQEESEFEGCQLNGTLEQTGALVQDEDFLKYRFEWRAKQHAILHVNYWSNSDDILNFLLLNGTS